MGKRVISLLLAFILARMAACAGAEAPWTAAFDRYLGIWVADGLAVEIRREGEELCCRAVFTDGGEESEILEYLYCFYDADEDALQCLGVTRTRERFDPLTDTLDELDWSMNDLSFAELRLSGDDLIFTDEALDAPVVLTGLNEEEDSARKNALTYTGVWSDGSASLRVEDHGSCQRFTVTVPVDGATSHRWTYTCLYDAANGRMASVNSSARTVITREPNGDIVEEDEDHFAGSAEFILEAGDRLAWRDVSGEVNGIFERIMK